MHDLQHMQFEFVWKISGLQPKKSHMIKKKQMCLLFSLSSVFIVFCAHCLLCSSSSVFIIFCTHHLLYSSSFIFVTFCACCLLLCNVIKLKSIDAFFYIEICQNWLFCQVCHQDKCFTMSHKMTNTLQKWCSSFIMFLETADSNVFISQLHLFFQQLSVQFFAFSFFYCFEFNL